MPSAAIASIGTSCEQSLRAQSQHGEVPFVWLQARLGCCQRNLIARALHVNIVVHLGQGTSIQNPTELSRAVLTARMLDNLS